MRLWLILIVALVVGCADRKQPAPLQLTCPLCGEQGQCVEIGDIGNGTFICENNHKTVATNSGLILESKSIQPRAEVIDDTPITPLDPDAKMERIFRRPKPDQQERDCDCHKRRGPLIELGLVAWKYFTLPLNIWEGTQQFAVLATFGTLTYLFARLFISRK